MKVRILGSAAGGGVPQWNCLCPNCAAARAGTGEVQPRTQSSVAVSADGVSWFLLNVSPDIRQQIMAFPALAPQGAAPRATPISGCILTDAEIDHASGLLFLRESCPVSIPIHSTALVRRWLSEEFPLLPVVSSFSNRPWIEIRLDEARSLALPTGEPSGLRLRAFCVEPHVPKFVKNAAGPSATIGATIGLEIIDERAGGKLLYAPCAAGPSPELDRASQGAHAVLLDGTFWSDDEPRRMGFSERSARQMGHWPVSGDGGSLQWFAAIRAERRIYVHINNTNPMLGERSPERAEIARAGARVGRDGDEFEA